MLNDLSAQQMEASRLTCCSEAVLLRKLRACCNVAEQQQPVRRELLECASAAGTWIIDQHIFLLPVLTHSRGCPV